MKIIMTAVTLLEYLEEQRGLEEEAAKVFPGKIESCTLQPPHYPYLRQPIYACLEHGKPVALCYACSVECHVDCERIVDLGVRRHFRCDCGGEQCQLKQTGMVNDENWYNNFEGRFCICQRDAVDGTMLQCWTCEDWFHTDCIAVNEQDVEGEFICPKCAMLLLPTPHLGDYKLHSQCLLLLNGWKPCDCEHCAPVFLAIHPYIYNVDSVYTPEPDDQIPSSLYERGMSALLSESKGQVQVKEAIIRLNEVKEALCKYLISLDKPIIEEEDIRTFFCHPINKDLSPLPK